MRVAAARTAPGKPESVPRSAKRVNHSACCKKARSQARLGTASNCKLLEVELGAVQLGSPVLQSYVHILYMPRATVLSAPAHSALHRGRHLPAATCRPSLADAKPAAGNREGAYPVADDPGKRPAPPGVAHYRGAPERRGSRPSYPVAPDPTGRAARPGRCDVLKINRNRGAQRAKPASSGRVPRMRYPEPSANDPTGTPVRVVERSGAEESRKDQLAGWNLLENDSWQTH
jgi:hypothetical protein